jgi:hypothetical protein
MNNLLQKIEKDDFLSITLDELLAHWGSEHYSPIIQATVCHLEELKRLRDRVAMLERENGALAENYLSKLGIKPEDLR